MSSPAIPVDDSPLYYPAAGDPNGNLACAVCLRSGIIAKHRLSNLFMNDPHSNPWGDKGDQAVYYVCRHHVPENAMIYVPADGTVRNKQGEVVTG